MLCEDIQTMIPLYIDGEETKENKVLVEDHLVDCKECQEFYSFSNSLCLELANSVPLEPEGDFLSRLHKKIEADERLSEDLSIDVKDSESEFVETIASKNTKKKTSRPSLRQRPTSPYFGKHPIAKLLLILKDKLKTPAFGYTLAVHGIIFFLAFNWYMSHKSHDSAKFASVSELDHDNFKKIRSQANRNSQKSTLTNGKVDISSFISNGTVYLTQTSLCIQLQREKPNSYSIKKEVKKGLLVFTDTEIKKYFSDGSGLSLLSYENGMEIWSSDKLNNYLSGPISIKI